MVWEDRIMSVLLTNITVVAHFGFFVPNPAPQTNSDGTPIFMPCTN